MQLIEIEKTNSTSVSCRGMSNLYDHPQIYLEIKEEIGKIECPYCSKIFELVKD